MKKILNKFYEKLIGKIIIASLLLFLLYFIVTLIGINHYLNEYGYGINELPKTVAVYFNLSKGFTVEQKEDGESVFIGRHDYIYEDLLKKKGYYETDRYGAMGLYTKNEKGEETRIDILSTNDWCHWFRIYIIDGAKIEDFI